MSFCPALCVVMLLGLASAASAQQLSPPGKPEKAEAAESSTVGAAQSMQLFDQLITGPVKEARRTLPQMQKYVQAGLPPGESFYLTTRVVDPDGTFEQVFVRVEQWEGSYVRGTIANTLETVTSFHTGQEIEFTTSAVLDWTLVRANGVEEGNYVGKFLDIQRHLDALER